MPRVLSLLLLLGLLLPAALAAQGPELRAAMLAGADGLGGEEAHLFFGGEAGATFRRGGVLIGGLFGSGNEFTSRLITLTPAFRVWQQGRTDLYLTAGAGQYTETLETGPSRDTLVLTGGLSGRLPLGPMRAALHLTAFTGSFGESTDGASPISVNGLRLAVGLGL